jgi:hypothetical protein
MSDYGGNRIQNCRTFMVLGFPASLSATKDSLARHAHCRLRSTVRSKSSAKAWHNPKNYCCCPQVAIFVEISNFPPKSRSRWLRILYHCHLNLRLPQNPWRICRPFLYEACVSTPLPLVSILKRRWVSPRQQGSISLVCPF